MTNIFISHSKDDPNIDFFHKALSGPKVGSFMMEFENIENPPYKSIKEKINASRAVFVLLSNPLLQHNYAHTRNWIDFEVGIACQRRIDVWVFEPMHQIINFAVPYATHHVRYESTSDDHVKILRALIENINKAFPRVLDGGLLVRCTNENCGISFYQLNGAGEFNCPSCRKTYTWDQSPQDIGIPIKTTFV